ncbi:MAG: HNH endonuclease [Gaiellaceae bacterium]
MSTYARVRRPGHPDADARGDVKAHRLVMAEWAGRPLTVAEVVHHVNRDRRDNRRQNLLLFPDQRAHLDFHRIEDGGRLTRYMPPVQTAVEPARARPGATRPPR